MIKNDDFLEQIIIKGILSDKKFFSMVYDKIEPDFFDENSECTQKF